MGSLSRRNFILAASSIPVAGTCLYTLTNVGPLKCGFVGLGRQGKTLIESIDPKYITIYGTYDTNPNASLFEDDEVPEWFQKHQSKAYQSLNELLADQSIEAVVIATPLLSHGEIAIKALQAGKHVFVERMMAATPDECREMTALTFQKGLTLQVGHPQFYSPAFWEAFRLIHEGVLGNIYHCRIVTSSKLYEDDDNYLHYMSMGKELTGWQLDPNQSYGMWSESCCDWLGWMNGLFPKRMPIAVTAYSNQNNQPEFAAIDPNVYAIIEYENNLTVTLSSSHSWDNFNSDYLQIMGTWGTLIITHNKKHNGIELKYQFEISSQSNETRDDFHQSIFESYTKNILAWEWTTGLVEAGLSGTYRMKDKPFYVDNGRKNTPQQLKNFAQSIRTQNPVICDGVMGMQIANTCYAAQLAAETQERVMIVIPIQINKV